MTWDPDAALQPLRGRNWVDPRTSPCPACGEKIEFAAGRRRCIDCRTWIHERCGVNPLRKDGRMFCEGCARRNVKQIVKGVARAINESDEPFPALEVVVWSGRFGQDEGEISSELGIPLEDVRRIACSLRKEGFWEDGKLLLPYGEEDGPQEAGFQIMVSMVLAALVADGLIERELVGPDGKPVPGEGGNDQNGEQESDEGDPGDAT